LTEAICWDNVVDFRWHRSTPSPHWHIIPPQDRTQFLPPYLLDIGWQLNTGNLVEKIELNDKNENEL
jgi:hypothetical protein